MRNEYVQRFLPREVDLVRKLNHPNIIRVFQVLSSVGFDYGIAVIDPENTLLPVHGRGIRGAWRPTETDQAREEALRTRVTLSLPTAHRRHKGRITRWHPSTDDNVA